MLRFAFINVNAEFDFYSSLKPFDLPIKKNNTGGYVLISRPQRPAFMETTDINRMIIKPKRTLGLILLA